MATLPAIVHALTAKCEGTVLFGTRNFLTNPIRYVNGPDFSHYYIEEVGMGVFITKSFTYGKSAFLYYRSCYPTLATSEVSHSSLDERESYDNIRRVLTYVQGSPVYDGVQFLEAFTLVPPLTRFGCHPSGMTYQPRDGEPILLPIARDMVTHGVSGGPAPSIVTSPLELMFETKVIQNIIVKRDSEPSVRLLNSRYYTAVNVAFNGKGGPLKAAPFLYAIAAHLFPGVDDPVSPLAPAKWFITPDSFQSTRCMRCNISVEISRSSRRLFTLKTAFPAAWDLENIHYNELQDWRSRVLCQCTTHVTQVSSFSGFVSTAAFNRAFCHDGNVPVVGSPVLTEHRETTIGASSMPPPLVRAPVPRRQANGATTSSLSAEAAPWVQPNAK